MNDDLNFLINFYANLKIKQIKKMLLEMRGQKLY